MDRQELSALAHADHRVAAPLSEDTVRQLLDRAIRRPDAHLLDLGCGAGAWLLHALHVQPGITAVGIDISDKGFARTRATLADLRAADRVELHRHDVVDYQPARKADVVLSVGAAHAYGDLLGTLDAAAGHLAQDGVVVLGDGFWEREPDPALRAEFEDGPLTYADLPTTVTRIVNHGWTPIYGHVSTLREWDDYEWSWTGSLAQWALDHPHHPDHQQALTTATEHRTSWLNGSRTVLGFLVLLLRRTPPASPAYQPDNA
jgi:SAM-dependent methyltransferase